MSWTVIAETIRRQVTNIGYLGYVGLLAFIGFGVSRLDRPGAVWPQFVGLLAIIIGCGPVGPEFSSGTLQLILVKPVKRWVYLISRVTGVVATVWLAALTVALFEIVGWGLGRGSIPWVAILTALGNTAAAAVLTVSLLTLLGSVTRAYFNLALYFALRIGLPLITGLLAFVRTAGGSVGRFLSEHTAIERAVSVIDSNLFPDFPLHADRDWILMVLSNAAIALVLACLAFARREVPYGTD